MAAAKKPNNSKPRVMDVTHPGRSAATPTSRPIIVNHHPIMQDPMVNTPSNDTNDSEGENIPVVTARKPKLQPLSAPEITESTESEPKKAEELATADNNPLAGLVGGAAAPKQEEKTEESALPEPLVIPEPTVERTALEPVLPEQPAPQEEQQPEPVPTAPEPEEIPRPAPASIPKTIDDDAEDQDKFHDDTTKPPMTTADDEVEKIAIREAAINKLADSRKYFLRINTVERRRTKRFVILGIFVSILLALAWVDIALDAGIIKLGGLKPVTHLFSN